MKKLIKITLIAIITSLLCSITITTTACKNINGLIQNLNNENNEIRVRAIDDLIKIGKPAVEPLIALLNNKKNPSRGAAALILGQIGNSRAIKPLIGAMAEHPMLGQTVYALSIMCKDKDNEKLIAEKIKELDDEFLTFRYKTIIHIGASGTEDFLISFLNRRGSISVAEDFANSGNDKLKEAARAWAKLNGYYFIQFTSSDKEWGSGGN